MQNDENKVKKSFFQGMKSELKKVVWPSARQTAKNTLVTIVFVLLISIVLMVSNFVFDSLSKGYYNLILGRNNDNSSNNQLVSGEVISGEVIEESGEATLSEESELESVETLEDNGEPVEAEISNEVE